MHAEADAMGLNVSIVTVGLNPAIDRTIETPELEVGQHVMGTLRDRIPAGKAVNVSMVLGALGQDSISTGFVGRGEYDEFEARLRSASPGRALCQMLTVAGRTRENITLIDPVNHVDTHIRDVGFEVTEQDIARMTSKVGLLCRASTTVVFSGSRPAGVSIEAFRKMVRSARQSGASVVLDLSGKDLRSFVTDGGSDPADPVVKEGEANSAPAQPRFFLIKPNLAELAELAGDPTVKNDPGKALAAAKSLSSISRWVAYTRGAEGAVLVGPEGAWEGKVDMPAERIINTVGCGDSMLAGLLDGFVRAQSPENVLKRGLAAATANAMTMGVATIHAADLQEAANATRICAAKASGPGGFVGN